MPTRRLNPSKIFRFVRNQRWIRPCQNRHYLRQLRKEYQQLRVRRHSAYKCWARSSHTAGKLCSVTTNQQQQLSAKFKLRKNLVKRSWIVVCGLTTTLHSKYISTADQTINNQPQFIQPFLPIDKWNGWCFSNPDYDNSEVWQIQLTKLRLVGSLKPLGVLPYKWHLHVKGRLGRNIK